MFDLKALKNPVDILYIYDGSIDGFFCCVYESVHRGELPFDIVEDEDAQPSLLAVRRIKTDTEKSARVSASIEREIGLDAKNLMNAALMSCIKKRELSILQFLLLGYQEGSRVTDMTGHPKVAPVIAAAKHLYGEVHLLKGFVRFSDYGGQLAATITPKNFVLPFLLPHFVSRFCAEDFMIYDKTHKAALIYQHREARIIPVDQDLLFPSDVSEAEDFYRSLWRQYYSAITIKERYNPKCRMSHIPKRYWENMLEMKDLL